MQNKIRGILKEVFNTPTQVSVLSIDPGCNQNNYNHLNNFIKYAQKHLRINSLPNVKIVDTRQNGMTTGVFIPSKKLIMVYGRNRALADIIRTLAHELTHYRQFLQNRIVSTARDWNLEAEADIEAGKMVYNYAHTQPSGMSIYE